MYKLLIIVAGVMHAEVRALVESFATYAEAEVAIDNIKEYKSDNAEIEIIRLYTKR